MFNWLRIRKAQSFDLPAVFREKIGHFRQLLASNNRILEVIAELSVWIETGQPVSLAAVQRAATTLGVESHRLVRALNAMSADRYADLGLVLSGLTERLSEAVRPEVRPIKGPLVVPLSKIDRDSKPLVGAKMANLGEIKNRVGLEVPDGFVVAAWAESLIWEKSGLKEEIACRLQNAEGSDLSRLTEVSSQIQALLMATSLPAELEQAISQALEALIRSQPQGQGELRVALRSSAVGEDEGETSFAGQFLSLLNVAPANVIADYKRVLASRYNVQAMIYREQMGLRDEDAPMAVGCLRMVPAKTSGIIYTRNPDQPQADEIIISAVWGLGRFIVDGRVQPQVISMSRQLNSWRIAPGRQERELVCATGEGCQSALIPAERQAEPCLSLDQARRLAEQALVLERHFGSPQDVEWAIDQTGRIFILQARPLRILALDSARPGPREVWPAPLDVEPLLSEGVAVSRGVAHGRVFLTRNLVDMLSFPAGSVLVSATASSHWAALVPRAAALVCDQGGLASHLATVAREFGRPAIFRANQATKILAQGQMVTVDAVDGKVYPGIVSELLSRARPRERNIKGSPVYNLLTQIWELVGPLNLIDPAAADFTPQGCQTLHDITRFAHEAALKEMFRLSEAGPQSARQARRLETSLPVEILLIDLGGGLKAAPASGPVRLDQVASRPALAFLSGLLHPELKWSGPGRGDLKGFMGVLARSAAGLDRQIEEAEGRMYFLAAEDYLNFSSRLAYHFANIDCLMTPEENANYVTFRLGGGGATPERRARRLRFLSQVLRQMYFSVETKGDVLTARLNMVVEKFIAETLSNLGRLIVCARQADMAMNDDAQPDRFAEAFLNQDYAFFFGRP